MIYLDNAATSLRRPPCVIEAVTQAMQAGVSMAAPSAPPG